MFHQASSVFRGSIDKVESSVDNVKTMTNSLLKELVYDKDYITDEEYARINTGSDIYLDANEMLKRGIATHIYHKGSRLTAEKYLDELKSKSDKSVMFTSDEHKVLKMIKGRKDKITASEFVDLLGRNINVVRSILRNLENAKAITITKAGAGRTYKVV